MEMLNYGTVSYVLGGIKLFILARLLKSSGNRLSVLFVMYC
jgi:hypothetical protein